MMDRIESSLQSATCAICFDIELGATINDNQIDITLVKDEKANRNTSCVQPSPDSI